VRQICSSKRAFESSQCAEIYHHTVHIISWLNNTHTEVLLPGVDNCTGNKQFIRVSMMTWTQG